jgi:hypothetical protein
MCKVAKKQWLDMKYTVNICNFVCVCVGVCVRDLCITVTVPQLHQSLLATQVGDTLLANTQTAQKQTGKSQNKTRLCILEFIFSNIPINH